MVRRKDITLSLLSGVLLILSFPPFDFYPLAWIAIIPLLISLWEKGGKTAFFLGTLTGFVYFAGTVYWTFNSIYFYGNVTAAVSVLLVIALSLYLGVYIGIFSMLFNFLSRSRFPALFLVPVIWVTLEFLRSYALTGFPWSLLGYSQYKFLSLIQIADVTGVYGVSFLVAALNGAIFDVVAYWPKRLSTMPLYDRWPMTIGLLALACVITVSLFYGLWRLNTEEEGQEILVSVIQGNIEQDKKWNANFKRKIMDTYKRLTAKAAARSPDLIIWPETAVPFIFGNDDALTTELIDFQKSFSNYLLFGSVTEKNQDQFANSAVLMSPDGGVLSVYDKVHLVPFGEYVPLREMFPFVDKLVVGIGDFLPGGEYTVMDIPSARISTLICYEIIFPGMVRKFANKGANLFVSITNDAWFGRTSAPYQHFSMAVFRAVENRVPVLRAANTGISGFIDTRGRIQGESDIFIEDVLTQSLTIGFFKKSFYSRYGDLFAFFCIIIFVLLMANNIYPGKRKSLSRFHSEFYGR